MKRNLLLPPCNSSVKSTEGSSQKTINSCWVRAHYWQWLFVKAKLPADRLCVQSVLRLFGSRLCVVRGSLCGPRKELNVLKITVWHFFPKNAYISLHVENGFFNNWTPQSKWSGMASVETFWKIWIVITQLWTSRRCVTRQCSTSREEWIDVIYEPGAVKILMSYLNVKG